MFAQPSIQMKSIDIRELSVLATAIERFPNLESIDIFEQNVSHDEDLFGGLSRLLSLQKLRIRMPVQSNCILFRSFRSCPKFRSLQMQPATLSIPDCQLLAETAPDLTSLDLIIMGDSSSRDYNLRSLTLYDPSEEDLFVITSHCPNLIELSLVMRNSAKILLSSATIGTALETFMILGMMTMSIWTGDIHKSVQDLSILPPLTFFPSFATDEFFIDLCCSFPNLKSLDVVCANELPSKTVNILCLKLTSLTRLLLNLKGGRLNLNSEEISRRRFA